MTHTYLYIQYWFMKTINQGFLHSWLLRQILTCKCIDPIFLFLWVKSMIMDFTLNQYTNTILRMKFIMSLHQIFDRISERWLWSSKFVCVAYTYVCMWVCEVRPSVCTGFIDGTFCQHCNTVSICPCIVAIVHLPAAGSSFSSMPSPAKCKILKFWFAEVKCKGSLIENGKLLK